MGLRARKVYWACLLLGCAIPQISAQDSTVVSDFITPNDSTSNIIDIDSGLVYIQHIDAMWLEFLSSNSMILDFHQTDTAIVALPQTSDQYKKGFEKLNMLSPLDLTYNPLMDGYINEYLRYGHQLSKLLGLSKLYFPEIEEILDRNDIPLELKSLSVIESALNPNARSYRGATGLWQFMLPTGKECGLQINSYIDERKEPIKATEAACLYLSRLYKIYGVWELAIAAYNCGPGNVNKAVRMAGGSKNFWKIRPYLPRETQKYVPKFMAMCYLMEYGELHGIVPTEPDYNYWMKDTVVIKEQLRFDQIAGLTSVTHDDLKNLNPQFSRGVIPESDEGRILFIPASKMANFKSNEQDLKNLKPAKKLSYLSQPAKAPARSSTNTGKKSYYTVRSGDVLGTISAAHGVTVSQLKKWNNLRGSQIKVGQGLVIYAKTDQEKEATKGTSPKSPSQEKFTYHTVRKGDTLWDIAKLYSGVDPEDIKRLNKGINPNNLKMGTKLRIKKI